MADKTPEERSESVCWSCIHTDEPAACRECIAVAIRDAEAVAVEKMREACAEKAENFSSFDGSDDDSGLHISRRIRDMDIATVLGREPK